jgi:hypothetical protein
MYCNNTLYPIIINACNLKEKIKGIKIFQFFKKEKKATQEKKIQARHL